MKKPRTDREEELVEDILMIARRDPSLKTNVERAVENAHNKYRQELIADIDDDFKIFKEYIIRRINPNLRGDRMATDNELRNKVIRLAHQHPTLRSTLLPVLKEASFNPFEAFRKLQEAHKKVSESLRDRSLDSKTKGAMKQMKKRLEDEMYEIDGYFQLGMTPATRRASKK